MDFLGIAANIKMHRSTKKASERKQDKQWCLLQNQLPELKQWCEEHGKTAFFCFFDTVICAAYGRYRRSRKSAWSKLKHIVLWVFEAALPAISAGIVYYLSCYVEAPSERSILFACAFALTWLSVRAFLEWGKKKNAMETWVRHSACFQHLHNTLGVFLFSQRTEADYRRFVADVFAVLEQNVDQFTLNMSANGLAERKPNE